MRIGSLFSGYGGLDLAVQQVLGGEVAWHVEYDKAPSRILDHHYPGVPNYGDVTKLDFTTVEPVDVITGGYPCQPFSHAGLRKGTNDERHLWPHVLRAIREMGPRLAILENVRGHLSLGFDVVLADLASVGWSARWGVVRASDAGACHQRARLFIVAYPSSGSLPRPAKQHDGLCLTRQCCGQHVANTKCSGRERGRAAELTRTPADFAGDCEGNSAPAADASGQRHGQGQDAGMVGRVGTAPEVIGRQTSPARSQSGDQGATYVADAKSDEQRESAKPRPIRDEPGDGLAVNWGDYGPAIVRWERVLGRPAPAPTEPGKSGAARLSPRFVEWMMGLPNGWVTDPAIGISRNDQLKALGNGVVPQQAALALDVLLQGATDYLRQRLATV